MGVFFAGQAAVTDTIYMRKVKARLLDAEAQYRAEPQQRRLTDELILPAGYIVRPLCQLRRCIHVVLWSGIKIILQTVRSCSVMH